MRGSHRRTQQRARRSVSRRRQKTTKGGGPRCDRWRTNLAVLHSKLALRNKHKGFERLAKQLYKAYLDVVTRFCNDRFDPSEYTDQELRQAETHLRNAYKYRIINHTDYTTAVLKMTTAKSGVRGATARRFVRELRGLRNNEDRNRILQTIQSGLMRTHQHPVLYENIPPDVPELPNPGAIDKKIRYLENEALAFERRQRTY